MPIPVKTIHTATASFETASISTLATAIKPIILFFYILVASTTSASSLPTSNQKTNLYSYDATYDVLRNGKVMAEQNTKLEKTTTQTYTLKDVTKGTKGLAAFTGFKRSERSDFSYQKNDWVVQKHDMQQKVTFSKRHYSFDQNEQEKQITGIHKNKPFKLEALTKHPVSAHMLPLRIAQLACREQKTNFKVSVLKSQKINTYRFTAAADNKGLIKVSRKYPKNNNKKSHIWLDPKQQCITIKSIHIDDDNTIETKLSHFNGAKVAM